MLLYTVFSRFPFQRGREKTWRVKGENKKKKEERLDNRMFGQ